MQEHTFQELKDLAKKSDWSMPMDDQPRFYYFDADGERISVDSAADFTEALLQLSRTENTKFYIISQSYLEQTVFAP